ncbi:hypothetical protein MMC22_003995 [Lobaria immixta]|nr:hypothetical protein [Lobaria immixta]
MDSQAAILSSSKAVDVKASIGLTNSLEHQDQWLDFLRISKDVHRALACDPVPWGDLPWEIKTAARGNLEAKCREHNLFVGRDISGVINWRLYHLQKPRKDSTRMREYAALSSQGKQGSEEPSYEGKPKSFDPIKDF